MSEQSFEPPKLRRTFIARLGDFLVAPSAAVIDPLDQQKARLAASTTLIVGLLTTVGFVASGRQPDGWPVAISAFGLILLAFFVAYALTRTRFFTLGAFIFVLGFCAAPFLIILGGETLDVGRTMLIFAPLGLIVGSYLLSPRLMLVILAILVGAFILLTRAGTQISGGDWAALGAMVAVGLILVLFNSFRARAERNSLHILAKTNSDLESMGRSLEARVTARTNALNRRTAQLEAASFVSRQTASILNPEQLLDEVVQLISDRFDFYHAAVFLLDTRGQFAILHAASSEGGKRMLARGHKLEVGREGIVGYAAYQRRAHIALDVGEEAIFFSNPDLPHTRSEMALPLIVRGRVIGVMDIQSTEAQAFAEEDINALQSLADQIALALDNARLLAESQSALKQLQSITTESSYRAWQERLKSQKTSFRYTPLGVSPIEQDQKRGKLAAVADVNTLRVPINLRGKEIGTIVINRKGKGQEWSENDHDLVSDISAQVALALENARLLEDLQRRANRDQAIAQAAQRFSQTTDMDTLLQLALREFHRLPSVEEVSVIVKQSGTGQPL
jgi:GAF domain-containing protein